MARGVAPPCEDAVRRGASEGPDICKDSLRTKDSWEEQGWPQQFSGCWRVGFRKR